VSFRRVFTHRTTGTQGPEFIYYGRPENEAHKNCGHSGVYGSKCDVTEYIERGKIFVQRINEMIKQVPLPVNRVIPLFPQALSQLPQDALPSILLSKRCHRS